MERLICFFMKKTEFLFYHKHHEPMNNQKLFTPTANQNIGTTYNVYYILQLMLSYCSRWYVIPSQNDKKEGHKSKNVQ